MTGPGGVDKYHQASMKDGYTNAIPSYTDSFWFVQFDHNAADNAGLELRVGGNVVS